MHFPAPVNSGEGAEGSKDRQVHPVNQDQDDQRNKDADGAPDRDVMVLVAGGNREHLGEQLHVGLRLSIRCQSDGGSLASTPNPTPGRADRRQAGMARLPGTHCGTAEWYCLSVDSETRKRIPEAPMLKGFKDFILRGNVIELSIAVVVGTAFTALVSAFTSNIVNPIIAAAGGVQTEGLGFPIWPGNDKTFVNIGAVITAFVTFLITAAVVYFIFVAPMNRINSLVKKPAGNGGARGRAHPGGHRTARRDPGPADPARRQRQGTDLRRRHGFFHEDARKLALTSGLVLTSGRVQTSGRVRRWPPPTAGTRRSICRGARSPECLLPRA